MGDTVTFENFVLFLTVYVLLFLQYMVDAKLDADCEANGTLCDSSRNEICERYCVCSSGYYQQTGSCIMITDGGFSDTCTIGTLDECTRGLVCVSSAAKCLCAGGSYYTGTSCISTDSLKPSWQAHFKSHSSILLRWRYTAVNDYTDSVLLAYNDIGGPRQSYNVNGTILSNTFRNLRPGTTYIYTVYRSITREGRTQLVPPSDPINVTTDGVYSDHCTATKECKAGLACVVSKCLCADGSFLTGTTCNKSDGLMPIGFGNNKSHNSVHLFWISPVATGYINSFVINYKDESKSTVYSASTSISGKTFRHLKPDRTYIFTVVRSITREGRKQTVPSSDPYQVTTNGIYTASCTAELEPSECITGLACISGSRTMCLCQEKTYFTGDLCKSTAGLKPTNVSLDSRTFNSISLSWTSPAATNYTDSYAIVYTAQGGSLQTYSVPGQSTTATVDNLNPGTTYSFNVIRSITKYGRTQILPASDTQKVTTKLDFGYSCEDKASECGIGLECVSSQCLCVIGQFFDNGRCMFSSALRPSITSIERSSASSVTINWNSPPATGYINSYIIKYTESGTTDVQISPVSGDVSTHLVTGLKAGTSYTFIVVRSITREGRTQPVIDSARVEEITKAPENGSSTVNVHVVIIIVDVVLVLTAVLLIIYFKLLRPRCQQKSTKYASDQSNNDHTYDEIAL